MYEMLSLSLYNQIISTEKQRSKHRRAVSLSPGSCTLFWHDAKEESLLNAHLRYVTDWNEVFRSDTAADLQWVKPKHFFFLTFSLTEDIPPKYVEQWAATLSPAFVKDFEFLYIQHRTLSEYQHVNICLVIYHLLGMPSSSSLHSTILVHMGLLIHTSLFAHNTHIHWHTPGVVY